jgi:hypothetical protein
MLNDYNKDHKIVYFLSNVFIIYYSNNLVNYNRLSNIVYKL